MTTSTCLWLTGQAGSGKRTVGRAVEADLNARGIAAIFIDDEAQNRYLAPGDEPLRWFCETLLANNVTVIVAISALHQSDREDLRSTLNRFLEVFLDAPAEVCAQRAGRTDSGFETPHAAELRVPTANRSVAASSAQVISFLEESGVISDASA